MDIALHLMIGETISYKKDEILSAIRQDKYPSDKNWYAITSACDDHNLMYIMSGTEYRNPMYHRKENPIKVIGLAGSRKEAMSLVQSLVQEFADSGSLMEMKASLEEY